jgi:hypothetical protein
MAAPDICNCGREIIRGSSQGRRPLRCTICRRIPPPAYEDHNRQNTAAIGPDGWPVGGVAEIAKPVPLRDRWGHDSRTATIESMTLEP